MIDGQVTMAGMRKDGRRLPANETGVVFLFPRFLVIWAARRRLVTKISQNDEGLEIGRLTRD